MRSCTTRRRSSVSRPASVATTITEGLALVAEHDKREALRRLIRTQKVQNALIFCNRKRDVDILYKSLTRHKFDVGALHGDMAQTVRFATLEKFKANELRLLVCSDVAARGLDIGGLSHVFNFDVPHHAEDYVHRIGRTGRAGLEGHAFTIAMPEDRAAVEAIEKLIGHPIPPVNRRGPRSGRLGGGRRPPAARPRRARRRRARRRPRAEAAAETRRDATDAGAREAGRRAARPPTRCRARTRPARGRRRAEAAERAPRETAGSRRGPTTGRQRGGGAGTRSARGRRKAAPREEPRHARRRPRAGAASEPARRAAREHAARAARDEPRREPRTRRDDDLGPP